MGSRAVSQEMPGAVVLYDDGTIERFPPPSLIPASTEFINGVATKDVSINPTKGTWVRIFLPDFVAHRSPSLSRAPLVLHFHGGGMCLGSPAEPMYHNFCSRMASASRSVWISVSYLLAPEHRLPTQYQDCYEALCWLRSQFATTRVLSETQESSSVGLTEPWKIVKEEFTSGEREPWVFDHGDATRVFCTGESAGGTILQFVAFQIVKHNWSPINIRGLMFVDSGVLTDPLPEMTPSTDTTVTTKMMATSVALCLPDGAKLGDPLLDCLHPNSKCLFGLQWPPILALAAERDLLRGGVLKYVDSLREAHIDVELYESEGKGHCFHLREDSDEARLRERAMVHFIERHIL